MIAALRNRGAPRDEHELEYRDAHRAVSEHGHIPGVDLDPGSLLLASSLLANGPAYIIRRATIARDLGVSERIVSMRLGRLRKATIAGVPLLCSRIAVPLHGRMPWWRPSDEGRAEANRYAYELAAAEILRAINVDRARRKAERAVEREAKRGRRAAWLTERGIRLVNGSRTSERDRARTLDPDLGSSPASPPTPAPADSTPSTRPRAQGQSTSQPFLVWTASPTRLKSWRGFAPWESTTSKVRPGPGIKERTFSSRTWAGASLCNASGTRTRSATRRSRRSSQRSRSTAARMLG
jgi:hypothetical protein